MNPSPHVQVAVPQSEQDFDAIRGLMRSFMDWHRVRHHDQLDLVFGYFDQSAFDFELANLADKYAQPEGCLLLAKLDGQPAGCVGLRTIEPGICEMKRMFVNPNFQGNGVGIALATEIISKARELGFSKMRLDSGEKQFEAHQLYRKVGFVEIPAYYDVPEDLRKWLTFMELSLA